MSKAYKLEDRVSVPQELLDPVQKKLILQHLNRSKFFLQDQQTMQMIQLTKERNTVGKSRKADVIIKDKSISNIHANIEINQEGTKAFLK